MDRIEVALDGIRQALQADGYELQVDTVQDSVLRLSVIATDHACDECLVPKDIMRSLIEQALTPDLGIAKIELSYPKDGNTAQHRAIPSGETRRDAPSHEDADVDGEPLFAVVDPVGRSAAEPLPSNPPLATLQGLTIGELWDWAFKGEEMFAIIRERLRERFPGVRFVEHRTFGNTHGKDEVQVVEALPELLLKHECHAVISAVGA